MRLIIAFVSLLRCFARDVVAVNSSELFICFAKHTIRAGCAPEILQFIISTPILSRQNIFLKIRDPRRLSSKRFIFIDTQQTLAREKKISILSYITAFIKRYFYVGALFMCRRCDRAIVIFIANGLLSSRVFCIS